MNISEEYVEGMRFFLWCAVCDGQLGITDDGKVIPDSDGVVRVKSFGWLKDNSPVYFKFYPKTGRIKYHTPQEALGFLWKELGMV